MWSRCFSLAALTLAALALAVSACAGPQRSDSPLLAPPAAPAGAGVPNGSLASARLYEGGPAEAPLRVYRVYSSAPGKAGPDGLYWTPAAPQGSRANYRRDYVICPEWNDLDRVRTCNVRPWALVAVGPGAAAKCKDGTVLAASEVPQVLIIPKWNPGAQQYQLPVEACSDTTATWAP